MCLVVHLFSKDDYFGKVSDPDASIAGGVVVLKILGLISTVDTVSILITVMHSLAALATPVRLLK